MKKIILFILLLVFYSNAYSQWTFQNSGTTRSLNKIYFANKDTGYVCGGNELNSFQEPGVFLKTTNGGLNWISVNYGFNFAVYNLCFLNSKTGYICGSYSNIRKTTNSGESWVNINGGYPESIYFINESTGFFARTPSKSLEVYRTTNGGLEWFNVIGSGGFFENTISNFYFINSTTGFFLRNDHTEKTTNAGLNWSSLDVNAKSISFSSVNNWISVNGYQNQGSISRSLNQGLNWSSIGLFSPGPMHNSVVFINLNTGFIACDSGQIKYTFNAGDTWQKYINSPPINKNLRLKSMCFINENTGYIVGDSGLIIKTTNSGGLTGIISNNSHLPNEFFLNQNYPNPFNPTTNIRYSIPEEAGLALSVRLIVYDVSGKDIETKKKKKQNAGSYSLSFNAVSYPSGVYFYRWSAGDFKETRKMILLK